ncbi:MAG: hypothetical protein KatS3mg028_0879 [Bacteroidia bacterium]|nr:MAG: hypothetical protein KatS3mg028_0879 [Bacteroidia bacterium]
MANYKKNLELVKEHLQQGEEIKSSIFGAYECKIMGNDSIRNGIFVATDRRIIFFAKKMMGYDLETFPYENISSIEKSKGLMGHTITFFASGNKATMKWINTGDINEFINCVNSNIGKKLSHTVNSGQSNDIPDQIKKLSELRDQGIITDDEFNHKKTELLSKM